VSLLAAGLLTGAALIAAGIAGMLRRRSLIGTVIGFEICLAGALVMATALLTLTGRQSSTALIFAVALIALAMGSAVVVAAVHLAIARASGSERGLEPW